MRIGLILLVSVFYVVCAEKGSVEMPLTTWERMVDQVEKYSASSPIEKPYCPVNRSIDGKVRKGLFKGVLKYTFVVLDSMGYIKIPVIDGNATLGNVLLNNQRTSLYLDNNMYTIGIDKPGIYTVVADVIIGKEVDRFDRELVCVIPDGGPTKVSIEIPEKNIDPVLKNGALISTVEQDGGTMLDGYLDAGGKLELSWQRKLTHSIASDVKSEMNMYTLCTVQEAIVTGQSQVQISINEGETDRIDLLLPDNIEITDIQGDAVLQWRTDHKEDNRLIVLLRHLVQDQVTMNIFYQLPIKEENNIALTMPYPPKSIPMTGVMGIQSNAGLNVQIKAIQTASQMELRDLPQVLTNMTNNPLLYGITYNELPNIKLSVSRHKDVSLTGTIIDQLQATSVIIKDGQEITKLKMRIRNNTRQYLKMEMPDNTQITHSLIDGMPVRPAQIKENGKTVLLFPLQQSEKIKKSSMRYHYVKPGETLSEIAQLYYSDPLLWNLIMESNKENLYYAQDIIPGQMLRIPPLNSMQLKESSFLIEMAYKKPASKALPAIGRQCLILPKLDVETVQALWHIYFPDDLEMISCKSNMTQLTAVRYGIFSRVRYFLKSALWKDAWAGGGPEYSNILIKRKSIYKEDFAKRSREESLISNFPLVGTKYRFVKNLSGMETPQVVLYYIPGWLSAIVKWIAFVAAFFITVIMIQKRKNVGVLATGILVSIFMIILAQYILGMHKRFIWGIDLALCFIIFRQKIPGIINEIRHIMKAPGTIFKIVSWVNVGITVIISVYLGIVLSFPMFFSSSLLIILLIWRRYTIKRIEEVSHE